jgi:hypothetical protein
MMTETCQYIVGGVWDVTFGKPRHTERCGRPVEPGSIYCAEHNRDVMPSEERLDNLARPNLARYAVPGLWIYYAGLAGMALFHETHIGPAWMGFLAGYLPSSVIVTAVHAEWWE